MILCELDDWKGTTNFTATIMDIFDILLRKELFIYYHIVIYLYLQHLFVMERENAWMMSTVTMP